MLRSSLIAASLAATLAVPALAGPAMNDLEIAHAAYTAGELDIRYAHLALALSAAEPVRDFARTMLRDHAAVNQAAGALVAELEVTPQDNELSRALVAGAKAKRDELKTLEGGAFDCAYALNELAYHQLVNQTVEESFIPSVKVPELGALLEEALVTFKAHEMHAAGMVTELGCDA